MRNPSKITTDLEVDDALEQSSDFEFDEDDRQYIDNQIRGTEQHLVDCLIRGRFATWVRLASGSAAVDGGDTVCLASLSNATEPTVTKCTLAALSDAKSVFGVVLRAAAPGAFVLVAIGGSVLPPSLTLLGTTAGYVRVNTTTSKTERVAALSTSDYSIGTVDATGWLQVFPAPALGTGVAGLDVFIVRGTSSTSIAIPSNVVLATLSDNKTYDVSGIVTLAEPVANAKRGRWKLQACAYRAGGGAAAFQGSATNTPADTNDGSFSAALNVSGNDVRLGISPGTADPVNWGWEFRFQEQS